MRSGDREGWARQRGGTSDAEHLRTVSPGKQTLTKHLPSRSASVATAVQQRFDPATARPGRDLPASSARWTDVAMRPDLYLAPVQAIPTHQQGAPASQAQGASTVDEPAHVRHAAAQGIAGGGGTLPYLDTLQQAFGPEHDLSDVTAHLGGSAADACEQMGATAYATGNHVAFKETPDLHTAAHETAHVLQQRAGVQLARGVGRVGDAYEEEADAVADTVVAGGRVQQNFGIGSSDSARGTPLQRQAVQCQEAPQQGDGAAVATAPRSGTTADAQAASNGLDALLEALQSAADPAARQSAATALTAWSREHVVDDARLRTFLQSSADNDVKTRIIGELRAEIARNEFLLGWSYEGGVSAGGANGWENTAANRGDYPDHYMEEVNTYGRQDGAPWCTSFAGYTATQLGFRSEPGNDETSMFWSGYRLDLWARNGTTNQGRRVTPAGQEVSAADNASTLVPGSDWQTLHDDLTALTRSRPVDQTDEDFEAALRQAVDEFLGIHVVPQAGDMFVYDDNNQIRGSSHTNLVERYDADARTIFTIGGNEGHAVGGRRIVLTDPVQVRRLASLVRIGAEFYRDAEIAADAMTTGSAGGEQSTGDASEATRLGRELVESARAINARLVAVLHGQRYISSNDAGATVLEWQTGNTTANASTSDH